MPPRPYDAPSLQFVHDSVEERGNKQLLSKSCTFKGRRQLSVMRKEMMEGLAFMERDKVAVVDIPDVHTLPSQVEDMGECQGCVGSRLRNLK